jgi:hypothetical protein
LPGEMHILSAEVILAACRVPDGLVSELAPDRIKQLQGTCEDIGNLTVVGG